MTLKSLKQIFLLIGLASIVAASPHVASAPALPNPVLNFIGTEQFTDKGKPSVRYVFEVFNRSEYPDAMFAAAPDLPPCGMNTKASRTWVDIFDQSGKRLYGFCAFSKPADLQKVWFALEEGVVPPSWVYIEMNDRQTNTKYKSNLSETSN